MATKEYQAAAGFMARRTPSSLDREAGFYWVQRRADLTWTVAMWAKPQLRWFTAGSTTPCLTTEFEKIGPRVKQPRSCR